MNEKPSIETSAPETEARDTDTHAVPIPPGTSHVVPYPSAPNDETRILASRGGYDYPAFSAALMHRYDVYHTNTHGVPELVATIQFQRGPVGAPDSTRGLFSTHVLAVMLDHLKRFQDSDFSCAENVTAIEHVQAALNALIARRDRRARRGVLGTHKPS